MKVDGCSVARLSLEQSYVSMNAVKPGKGDVCPQRIKL